MATQLELLAEKFRQEHVSRNVYNLEDRYGTEHKNTISDGDEKGKNEIGSSVDIQSRTNNIVKNAYTSKNEYSREHKNAISDGDEKGKNEIGIVTGKQIGRAHV